MDLIKLYQEYNIHYATDGHAHCQTGWVQIACPFCTGSPGFHLGFNLQDNFFNCWRCGFKTKEKVVSSLLSISEQEAYQIIKRYGGSSKSLKKRKSQSPNTKFKKFLYPSNSNRINLGHQRYLKSRNFNPRRIERMYKIKGTGPVSLLNGLDYKWRLIIPIIHEGKEVSWQSRAIKDYSKKDKRQKYKYLTCPKEYERTFHKDILYGLDEAKKHDWCVLCEGIMDVWRLGAPAVSTFGVKVSVKQMRLLAEFETIFITFDPDMAGVVNALKIQAQLEWMGKTVHIINDLESDPGDMRPEYANRFMMELNKMRGELK